MADTGPRREEVAAAMVQSGTVGRMSMSPSPFYRRNNVSRGNALGVPKDCPGVRSALCPENDANALPKPISIHPPPVSFHWGGGGYEIPDELALASVFSEMKWLAVEWWPIDRCHQKRKKKNVCVYRCQRLTDFFLRGKEVGMRERGVKRKAKEIEIRRNERN